MPSHHFLLTLKIKDNESQVKSEKVSYETKPINLIVYHNSISNEDEKNEDFFVEKTVTNVNL